MKPTIALASAGVCLAVLVWFRSSWSESGAPPSVGLIEGRVVATDGSPVEFARVDVLGRPGVVTCDVDGRFMIRGVAPGHLTLQVLAMGHAKLLREIDVHAGSATRVDLVLGESKTVTQLPEIVVSASAKKIKVDDSHLEHRIGRRELKEIIGDGLVDVVDKIPGIVIQGGELHSQGSRGGETQTRISGMASVDGQTGRSADVAVIAVSEVSVVTSGADAEVGGSLSGVIDVSTREGADSLSGEARWDTDRYGDPSKTFDRYDRIGFAVGGRGPLPHLTFFTAYEGAFADPYPHSPRTSPSRTVLDFIRLGNRQSNQIRTSAKLAYRAGPADKLTLESIVNRSIVTPYEHMWSRTGFVQIAYDTVRANDGGVTLQPRYGSWSAAPIDSASVAMNLADHTTTADDRFRQLIAVWTHQIDSASVWITRIASLEFNTQRSVGHREPWEYDTQAPFYWTGNAGPGTENNPYFVTHGDFPRYERHRSSTLALKSDVSSQRWDHHTLKSGVEAQYHRFQNLSLVLPNQETNGLPGGSRSDFVNYQPEASAYLQDGWQYEGLVLNAGLRCDVFTPGEQIAADELPSGHRFKQQLSPRIGVAYPISVKDALSFHYGWTFQAPQRGYLFENRGLNASVNVRGNPDLEPETNIAYQAALQHLFTKDLSGQFSVFFRDIFGLIGVRQEKDAYGNLVNVYTNGDYASARGVEASVSRSFSHRFSADVSYTYSLASGVASDPNEALLFFNGGRRYLPIGEGTLDWDQRHTLSFRSTIREPGRWGMRLLWTYGSGFPFTPSYRDDRRPDPKLANSRRLPSTSTLSLDLDRYFRVWGQPVTAYVDARNVLDASNLANLSPNAAAVFNPNLNVVGDDYAVYYTETGRAGGAYLADRNGDGTPDWVPVHDPRVYDEGRQVRLGLAVAF